MGARYDESTGRLSRRDESNYLLTLLVNVLRALDVESARIASQDRR